MLVLGEWQKDVEVSTATINSLGDSTRSPGTKTLNPKPIIVISRFFSVIPV